MNVSLPDFGELGPTTRSNIQESAIGRTVSTILEAGGLSINQSVEKGSVSRFADVSLILGREVCILVDEQPVAQHDWLFRRQQNRFSTGPFRVLQSNLRDHRVEAHQRHGRDGQHDHLSELDADVEAEQRERDGKLDPMRGDHQPSSKLMC